MRVYVVKLSFLSALNDRKVPHSLTFPFIFLGYELYRAWKLLNSDLTHRNIQVTGREQYNHNCNWTQSTFMVVSTLGHFGQKNMI